MKTARGPDDPFSRVRREILACRVCAAHLPFAPRPIVRGSVRAVLMIVGQAPGRRVHETGIPWNDPSGDRLREWLNLSREEFYDEERIAILAAGFCYPGKGKSGDLPPRPECAPLWHPRLRAALPNLRLTLLLGGYAQAHYLGAGLKASLAGTVRAHHEYQPEFLPLPHPSPRNVRWFKEHAWFEGEVVPHLRQLVARVLNG